MSEEKLLKKWLKRKITITKSLLISFLITGVIGYSETPSSTDSSSEIEMLKTKIAELEAKVNELETSKIKYVSIKSENGENIDNKGANAENSIAIGKDAKTYVAKNRNTTDLVGDKFTGNETGNVSILRTGSISIGYGAISSGSQIAIGKNARFEHSINHWADGYSGIAIGENAFSRGPHIAIGQNSRVEGLGLSVGVGKNVDIDSQSGTAIGYSTKVYSHQGVAIGVSAQAGNQLKFDFIDAVTRIDNEELKKYILSGNNNGTNIVVIGHGSRGEGQGSLAVGSGAKAINFSNTAVGENAYASGSSSQSFGAYSKTLGSLSTAVGYGAQAFGRISSSFGGHARAFGYGSVSLGYSAITGDILTEEEYNNLKEHQKNAYLKVKGSDIHYYSANDSNKIFYVINDTQNAYNALAVGTASRAVKQGTSLGANSNAGNNSVSVGYKSYTKDTENSISIGSNSKTTVNNSIAIGAYSSIAGDGVNSVVLGSSGKSVVDGGVSLGNLSVANIAKGVVGYDPITNTNKTMEDIENQIGSLELELQTLQNEYETAKQTFETKAIPYNENIDKLDSYNRQKEQLTYRKKEIMLGINESNVNRVNRDDYDSDEKYNEAVAKRKEKIDAKVKELEALYEEEKQVDENIKQIKTQLDSSIKEIVNMPEYKSRAELLKKINDKQAEINKLTSTWKSNSGAVSIGDSEKGITRQLTNLSAGTEDTDAVNVAQLKEVVKLNKNLQDAIGFTDEEINKINDPNLSKEDKPKTIIQRINDIVENGLKDKDLTNKVNSLRNGESGLIVYTDEDGNNLVKSEDGKFYKSDSVEITDGKVVVNDNSVEIKSEDIKHSLVNIDGTTKKESILGNVAKGVKDTDAVNVAQLNDVVSKALNSSSFANSDLYEDKTDEDGNKLDKEGNKLVKDETDGKYYKDNGNGEPDKTKESTEPDRVLKGIKFVGNIDTKEYKKTLGEEVKIFGNSNAENANDYSVKNVLTENTTDGILIKMSDMPEFKKVVVSDDTGKSTTITPDGITIKGSNGNDGKDGKTATIKIDKDGDIVINNEKIITNGNFEKIEKNSQSALSGVASSMAMAAIPQVIDKNRPYTIGAATALYKGESALAVGISGVNKTGNLIFKASSSINSKLDLGAAIGVSYAFGNGFDNSLVDLTSDKSDFIEYVEKLETKLNDKDKEIRLLLENQKKEYDSRLKALEEKMGNLNTIEKNYENIEEDLYENTICSFNRCVISGFDNDSYLVSENNKEFIREMVEILNTKVEYAVIDVIGHTDSKGKFNYNVDLGLQRAKSVAKLLKEYGLKKEIVFRNITSSADISDIFDNTSKNGRSQNRRVELHFDMIKYK